MVLSHGHGHQIGMTLPGGRQHRHITRTPRPHIALIRHWHRSAHPRRRPAAAGRENDVSPLGTAARTECGCGGGAGPAMVGLSTTAANRIRSSCRAEKAANMVAAVSAETTEEWK